jgi:hypothetical protein
MWRINWQNPYCLPFSNREAGRTFSVAFHIEQNMGLIFLILKFKY